MKSRLRLLAVVAVAAFAMACESTAPAPTNQWVPTEIDVTAGPGEADGLDQLCEVSEATDDGLSIVRVLCVARTSPRPDDVRASLVDGFGLPLAPAGPRVSRVYLSPDPPGGKPDNVVGEYVVSYEYLIDTGERPFKPPPAVPTEVARLGHVASCIARFDLTPEGTTTNSCVTCAATGSEELFEEAAQAIVASWIYPPASESEPLSARHGVLEGLKFELNAADGSRITAPPAPEEACGARAPAEDTTLTEEVGVVAAANASGPEPLVRVPPRYPTPIAGHPVNAACLVSFDLKNDGSTANLCARCNASRRPQAFEREAVHAVSQWRYPPSTESRTGLSTELEFVIEGNDDRPEAPTAAVCEESAS